MNNTITYQGNWHFDVRKDFILNPTISCGAKVVYLALKSHCSPDGNSAFPSTAYLAKCIDVSEDTILKYVRELKKSGLVETTQRGEAGKFTHTHYTIKSRAEENTHRTDDLPHPEKPGPVELGTKSSQCREEQSVLKEEEQPSLKKQADEVFSRWNRLASSCGLPKCLGLSDRRLASINQRMRDRFFTENWINALEIIPTCQFLLGVNNRGWKADLDWFLQPSSVMKIMEGKYGSGVTVSTPSSCPVWGKVAV